MTGLEWNQQVLKPKLVPLYFPSKRDANGRTVQQCMGGHDPNHVDRMVKLAIRKARELGGLGCPLDATIAGIIGHNIDHVIEFMPRIKHPEETIFRRNLYELMMTFLEDSPYDAQTRHEICDAVARHSLPEDPSFPQYVKVLQFFDRADRWQPINAEATGAHRYTTISYNKPPVGPWYHILPDGPVNTLPHTLYTIQFTNFEWIWMMEPEFRSWIDAQMIEDARDYVDHLRLCAKSIARHLEITNEVEEDLRKALRQFYPIFATRQPVPDRWWELAA